MVGQTIGHFEILEKIGAGGMGEVYLADDSTLGRKVALKFLPKNLQQDEEAKRRFVREARSAAALDHPFICNIHQIGEVEDSTFIAMEYVQGQTLKERLADGPIDMAEATRIATEISQALEKAHENGIIHRDLKPSNIMLTPQGHVKVMDFGLAKQLTQGLESADSEGTLTASLTQEGVLVGTLGYMSPEQVRGEKLDYRSDLFSLGVVYYELLTGRNPFTRDNPMDTLSAVLTDQPLPLSDYIPVPPARLTRILDGLLEKKIQERYASAVEVTESINQLSLELASLPGVKTRIRTHRIRRVSILVSLVALIAIVSVPITSGIRNLLLGPPPLISGEPFAPTDAAEHFPAWQPQSGTLIAYASESVDGEWNIWTRDVRGGSPTNLTDDMEGIQDNPVWSPDGYWLAFRSINQPVESAIYLMTFNGDRKQRAYELNSYITPHRFCLSWTQDSLIVFNDYDISGESAGAPLYQCNPWTGLAEILTDISQDTPTITNGTLSPDGRYLVFGKAPSEDLSNEAVFLLDRETGIQTPLPFETRLDLEWSPSGKYLYFLNGPNSASKSVFRARFNTRSGKFLRYEAITAQDNIHAFSMSPDESQIITAQNPRWVTHIWRYSLDSPPSPGNNTGQRLTGGKVIRWWPRWVPGTDNIVFNADRGAGNYDIWYLDTTSGNRDPNQLTHDPLGEGWPVVSRDGKWIAYVKNFSDGYRPWIMGIDGGQQKALEIPPDMLAPEAHFIPGDWSHTGWKLAGRVTEPDSSYLAILTIDPTDQHVTACETVEIPGGLQFPKWSPDDRYIGYRANIGAYLWTISVHDHTINRITSDFQANSYLLGWAHGEENDAVYFAWMMKYVYVVPIDQQGRPIGSPAVWGEKPQLNMEIGPQAEIRGNEILLSIAEDRGAETDLFKYILPEKW